MPTDARLVYAARYARRAMTAPRAETERCIPAAPHRPDPAAWPDDRLTASWLGHATVLLNFAGTWLVTDPVLESRIGLGRGFAKMGPRRLIQPALGKRELPRLDGVLLSHAHMDHTDLGTLRAIPAAGARRRPVGQPRPRPPLPRRGRARLGRDDARSATSDRVGRDPPLGRADGDRPPPRLGRLPAAEGRPHRPVRRRHGLHRRVHCARRARPGRSRHPADRRLRPLGHEPRLARGDLADVPRPGRRVSAAHPPLHLPAEPRADGRAGAAAARGRGCRALAHRDDRGRPDLVVAARRSRARWSEAATPPRFGGVVISEPEAGDYSTVTDLARFRGWSTLHPRATAT